jgi:hypothetical protein
LDIPRRLPHVLTRRDLALLVAPTYAKARSVEADEAVERLERALGFPEALHDLYRGISAALDDARGPRTSEDALIDRISASVAGRRGRAKAAEGTPALAAALVRLDLEIGLAPSAMRETLASAKGSALLEAGLKELGAHLVKELTRERRPRGADP